MVAERMVAYASSMSGPRPKPADGFTLIEMLVVLVILGAVAALVMQRAPTAGGRLTLSAAASDVAAALRHARGQAIATQRAVLVRIDPVRHSIQTGAGPARALPPGLGITVRTTADQDGIAFYPDGSSSGGGVDLTSRGKHAEVGVDWISGRIIRRTP